MTTDFLPLDALEVPLEGVGLVEANAGTGKTWNIVSLYLRLVLQEGLGVDRILVVSFTEAATAELRERVRLRLNSLREAFETGHSEDAGEQALLEACEDRPAGLRRLVRALQSFDQAAIYTIHGFCQRLLGDAAFEAGLALTTELVTDDSALRRQIVDDFWHAQAASAGPVWLGRLMRDADPARLEKHLARYFNRPLLRRLPVSVPASDENEVGIFERHYRAAQAAWRDDRDAIADLLYAADNLHRGWYKRARLDKLIAAADLWALADGISTRDLREIAALGATKLSKGARQDTEPPQHPFFDLLQSALDAAAEVETLLDQRLPALQAELLAFADRTLPAEKRRRRIRHFDDLLTEVFESLRSANGAALREAATRQYGAALIDEFQDTDPLQFAIFDELFCKADLPVFFVGDPKQAIYGFRGADVFAYLDARRRAAHRYRLDQNYRSTASLVDSVNALFATPNPFLFEQIDYRESSAARDLHGLLVDGVEQPAMRWWKVPSADGEPLKRADAEKLVAECVATDIRRLLDAAVAGRVRKTAAQPLEARDIAVLVKTHKQGNRVRKELASRGIGCMQRTEDSVFCTAEADELRLVLRAIVEPGRHEKVRAALATRILGLDARDIDALARDDRAWQDHLDRFAAYQDTWRRRGFASMYRGMIRDYDVYGRLLGLPDGARGVTNLAHLADLLQGESVRHHGRLEEVLAWMRQQSDIERPSDQAMLLRLDSDENLVNVMTVHYSKGLQFPVVYCPYLWTPLPEEKGPVVFHDERNRASLDLGSDRVAEHRERFELELYAENVRLAYVALTRAELACTAVWGSIAGAGRSGLNWLLHGAGRPVREWRASGDPDDRAVATRLDELARAAGVTATALPDATDRRLTGSADRPGKSQPRRLRRNVPRGWQVSSFSSLTRRGGAEGPRDYDAGKSESPPETREPAGIFAFPRGARAGRCMHALFENIAFDAPRQDIEAVAENALREHGFDTAYSAVLGQMAVDVLATPLDDTSTLCLRDIDATQRVSEMEFYFPSASLDGAAMRRALGEFGSGTPIAQRLRALDFRIGAGYLHGFIDLVFTAGGRYYLVDWKSNWLGAVQEDYDETRIARQIALHDYYLQYLIYTVALHRHLRRLLPDYDYARHYGGVFYLFVRGMRPATGARYGVFGDRPPAELIGRLDEAFAGEGE